jgi:hypothetical protein
VAVIAARGDHAELALVTTGLGPNRSGFPRRWSVAEHKPVTSEENVIVRG